MALYKDALQPTKRGTARLAENLYPPLPKKIPVILHQNRTDQPNKPPLRALAHSSTPGPLELKQRAESTHHAQHLFSPQNPLYSHSFPLLSRPAIGLDSDSSPLSHPARDSDSSSPLPRPVRDLDYSLPQRHSSETQNEDSSRQKPIHRRVSNSPPSSIWMQGYQQWNKDDTHRRASNPPPSSICTQRTRQKEEDAIHHREPIPPPSSMCKQRPLQWNEDDMWYHHSGYHTHPMPPLPIFPPFYPPFFSPKSQSPWYWPPYHIQSTAPKCTAV